MALRHELAARRLTQGLQQILLLVEAFGPEANSGFGNLGRPLAAMPNRIYRRATAGMPQLRYSALIRLITRVRSCVIVR